MNSRHVILGLILGTLALGACSREPRSVQYFKDNPAEAKATLEACRSEKTENRDCENAATALLIGAQRKKIPSPKFPTTPAQ